jgi:hypothetical protein
LGNLEEPPACLLKKRILTNNILENQILLFPSFFPDDIWTLLLGEVSQRLQQVEI